MDDTAVGILAAIGSMLFFGSFAVPMKTPRVINANVNPIIYQSYKSFACFLTSWLVLIYTPLKFTWWGMLGALIWVITGSAGVRAVQLIGIGLAQSLWSCLSIIVSYIWGAYVFKESIQNHTYSFLSVFVMILGMLGVGTAVAKGKIDDAKFSKDFLSSLLSRSEDAYRGNVSATSFIEGVSLATLVGVLNGSFLIPLKYAHKDVVGVEYLVSFGVGSLAMTLFVLGIYWCSHKLFGYQFPSFQVEVAAGPALLTGVLWSLGNYLSIYATLYLGLSLGWPLVQCQLLVSAAWAVFYYREVTSCMSAGLLVTSSLVVVAGAVMLSIFGTVG